MRLRRRQLRRRSIRIISIVGSFVLAGRGAQQAGMAAPLDGTRQRVEREPGERWRQRVGHPQRGLARTAQSRVEAAIQ